MWKYHINGYDLPVTTKHESETGIYQTSDIKYHFHINGHDLPVTTNNESFVVFPNT
ncbi:Uncharacterized protein dnm_034340 [Desulfonema magnum]|uniref:Uncharacterized protein n=1 Tax=Desulfonema magnum TaxID=45655 RepID=A0A975GMX5_9BACT|nr:Uncharacterized protein dnm_034340 [Desulfonema magnum]